MGKQRVLVTAAASGIGREIARAFAANGADVFVCDLNAAGLDDVAKEIPGLKTGVCDVSKRSDIERMVKEGVDALGGLDVLVNNAGGGSGGPAVDLPWEDWRSIVALNLDAPFACAQRAARIMIDQGRGGRIVNVTSVHE
ncbi:MAG TPA: SDR family oxidoreductase, partial [Bradyrhizobium sp.]|nr:SDR family oxidoreductase [Bradyrhizobium sp.]